MIVFDTYNVSKTGNKYIVSGHVESHGRQTTKPFLEFLVNCHILHGYRICHPGFMKGSISAS